MSEDWGLVTLPTSGDPEKIAIGRAVQGKMCSVGGWRKMCCPGKFLWMTF